MHIPKTGGNSLNRAFGCDWEDHKDLARYREQLPAEVFNAYFKFAVVRNPWDRLFSEYNYQRRKSRPRESKLFLYDAAGRLRSFAEWVRAALARPFSHSPAEWGGDVSVGLHRFSPQVDWISLDGVRRVDALARFETLDEDFRGICRHLGLKSRSLPHRNRRFHFHYSYYYDAETRDAVGRYYAADIETFRYDFEDRRVRRFWLPWFAARDAGTSPDSSQAA